MDSDLAQLLSHPPDPKRPYVYFGTRSRINHFGILNPDALDRVVRVVSRLRNEQLQTHPIEGQFDLAHLCAIHRHLFQDVYPWAGEIRIVDFNEDPFDVTSRNNLNFTVPADIVTETTKVLAGLSRENHLRGLDRERFADRLTYYLSMLYNIHPFRDGNGRSLRVFLGQLANRCGWQFDLDTIPQYERHETARTAHCGDMGPLAEVVHRVTHPLATCNVNAGGSRSSDQIVRSH